MTEQYEAIASSLEAPSDFEQGDCPNFAFNQEMTTAVEVRQLQIEEPQLAFDMTAIRSAVRVLELLKTSCNAVA